MVRSVLSIVIGFTLWSILWIGGNQALAVAMPDSVQPDGSVTSDSLLLILLVFSDGVSILSGYVTAMISKRGPRLHALILGFVLLGVGIPIQLGYWDKMPQWYHFGFLSLLVPSAFIGGWLRGATRSTVPAA